MFYVFIHYRFMSEISDEKSIDRRRSAFDLHKKLSEFRT